MITVLARGGGGLRHNPAVPLVITLVMVAIVGMAFLIDWSSARRRH